jgi:hypothetical protein
MRRLEQWMPMPPKVAMALIVSEDEQDVGRRGRGDGGKKQKRGNDDAHVWKQYFRHSERSQA